VELVFCFTIVVTTNCKTTDCIANIFKLQLKNCLFFHIIGSSTIVFYGKFVVMLHTLSFKVVVVEKQLWDSTPQFFTDKNG
jgi:hypothetical protein